MSRELFEAVSSAIKDRRSISWSKMNGKQIPDETVKELLELAHWAPTHGRTEPWRFFVFTGEALQKFGKDHAELYRTHTPADKFQEMTYNKLEHNVDKASHLLIAAMERGANVKIPFIEEIAATSVAIQNILLGAHALGIAGFWGSGGMTHNPALKDYLGLGEHDVVLGMLFLGYTDEEIKEGTRNTTISEKVKWL